MQEVILSLDVFPSEPKPSVMGKQEVSETYSLLFSALVVMATVWISFNSIGYLWIPLVDLPITSGIGKTENMQFSPFIIVPVYYQKEDRGHVHITYKNSLMDLQTVSCPKSLEEKIDASLMECFITRPISIEENQQILFMSQNSITPHKILMQKFSLETQVQNKQPYLFENILLSFLYNFIEVIPIKLTIYDSLISQNPSSQNVGILSYSSLYQTTDPNSNLFGGISFSKVETCLEYKINRDNFLVILAAVTSWFQSVSGGVAVIVIFNALVLKRLIASRIYRSRVLFKKLTFFKLYLFNILDIVSIGSFLNSRFKCFRKQAIVSEEIDKKLSIQNIFRFLNYHNQKHIEQMNEDDQKGDENLSCSQNEIQNEFQSKASCSKLNYMKISKSSTLPANSSQKLNEQCLMPSQQDSFISNFFQKFNMNSIDVSFSSEQNNKASILSVIVTVIGLALVLVLLWYLGAFAPNQLRDSKYIVKQHNNIELGSLNTPIYAILLDYQKKQVFLDDAKQTILFIKMDKDYKIIQTYIPSKNCTGKNVEKEDVIYNYCLEGIIFLQSSEILTQRFGVMATKLYDYELILRYKTVEIAYNNIWLTVSQMSTPLIYPSNREAEIQRTHFTQGDSPPQTLHQIKFNKFFVENICNKSSVCIILTLIRTEYMLTILEDSSYYMFQNVWSTTYLLFSFLIIFLIMPYNRKVSKNYLEDQVSTNNEPQVDQQNLDRKNKVFEISSMILVLESKSVDRKVGFVKTSI